MSRETAVRVGVVWVGMVVRGWVWGVAVDWDIEVDLGFEYLRLLFELG